MYFVGARLTHRRICKYYKCTNLNWYTDSQCGPILPWLFRFLCRRHCAAAAAVMKKGLCRLFTIFNPIETINIIIVNASSLAQRAHFNFCFCLPMRSVFLLLSANVPNSIYYRLFLNLSQVCNVHIWCQLFKGGVFYFWKNYTENDNFKFSLVGNARMVWTKNRGNIYNGNYINNNNSFQKSVLFRKILLFVWTWNQSILILFEIYSNYIALMLPIPIVSMDFIVLMLQETVNNRCGSNKWSNSKQ